MKYFIYYLIVINIISFLVYGMDKYAAKKNLSRVSERCLFFFGFIGGCLGALFGMVTFRHKTKKIKFYLWNIINLGIWLYLFFSFLL